MIFQNRIQKLFQAIGLKLERICGKLSIDKERE